MTTERYIGIRHRVKRTTEGEARPTQVTIIEVSGTTTTYDLAEEIDEFDFLHGQLPIAFRKLKTGEDLSPFQPHHIKWRALRKSESAEEFEPRHRRQYEGKTQIATQVPKEYTGLAKGDQVGMILGGSGDYFAYALARKGMTIGATIRRIPPFILKKERSEKSKDADAELLATLCRDKPSLFFTVLEQDMKLIQLRMAESTRKKAQRERIACGNRVVRLAIGEIFCNNDGLYPEGGFKNAVEAAKDNSEIHSALLAEEKRMDARLEDAVERTAVYTKLFQPIAGMGPAIASPIIVGIGDIRRFEKDSQLKAFCGVHLLSGGRFPRRRAKTQANWSGEIRQALFLFAEQCVYRPDSDWGKYYRKMKDGFRERHPEVITIDGKQRYTPGHTHRMAIWRTLTRFVERLHREWWRFEKDAKHVPNMNPMPSAPESETPAVEDKNVAAPPSTLDKAAD